MSKQDLLKTQTCVLRVNIDCDGCKTKVKRILQKIDGVYATAIDMHQGKVTVTGNVEPGVLIRKLEKSGKRAELWSSHKGNSNKSKNSELENVNEQLKKLLQAGDGKGWGDDVKKSQPKGGKDQQKSGVRCGGDGKNLQQINFQQFLEQMKSGPKDFNMNDQQKPAVKVNNLPGKDDGHDFGDSSSGDDLDEDNDYDDDEFDEEDDEFDEEEDEFDVGDYDDDEDEKSDHGGDQHHKQQKKFIPIMSSDLGKDEKGGEKAKKGDGGGGDDKKNGGIMSMIGRAIGGKNEGKDGNLGKKGGGEGGGKSQSGGKNGRDSKNSGVLKNGGEDKDGKKGAGGMEKGGGFQDLDVPKHTKSGGGGGMGQMGQYPVGPMGHQFLQHQ